MKRHLTFLRTIQVFVIAAALALGMTPVFAASPPFQLDGNAVQGIGPGTGDDWDVVNTVGGSSLAKTGLIVDRPEPANGRAQFTSGGSKDQSNTTEWKWRSGTPTSKDDITNAYAAAYTFNGRFFIVFGMDRFDTNGDAQLGFWFLQGKVSPQADGTFGTDGHNDNDLLVLVNFTNGGSIPTINVYRWVGGGVTQLGSGGQVLCAGGWIPEGQNFCGITNSVSVDAPWSYDNKDVGITNKFPPGAFFEGAIDVTAELGDVPCFSNFLAESRSSQSITAILKDFAEGGFNVCGISVDKTCTNPQLTNGDTQIIYDIAGKVKNIGPVSVFNVSLSDAPPAGGAFSQVDCGNPSTVLGSFPLSSLAGFGEACYKNTMTVAFSDNGLQDTVTATANSASDNTGTSLTATSQATCPKLVISPAISVTKDCTTQVVAQNNTVFAKVNVSGQVCNTGDSKLTGVTVVDNADNTKVFFGPATLSSGACQSYSGSYIPSAANDASDVPTTDPTKVVFKDTVKASGTDILGEPITPDYASAQCKLCPCPTCP